LNSQITQGDRAACCDLFAQDAWRKRFAEDMAFEFRMLLLEGCDKLRQDKELISTDKNDELRFTRISVDIGDIVDIGYMET
jgi:hypothetical protein